jgi:hypothetical protein
MRGGPTIATLSLLHAANTRKLFYTATVRAATLARNVRFGSAADMCAAKSHVRFTPNSDRESGPSQKAMSALHPKADMCSALADVC